MFKEHNSKRRIMGRKKAIMLSAVVETMVLGILLALFFTEVISFDLFIILAVLVGFLSSAAVLVIIRKTEP